MDEPRASHLETGNAVPQFGGELRPGHNLFDNSVVALDIKTGRIRWYYQLVHHDIWEHDVSTPLVLYDANVGGRTRKLMAAMRTDGVMFYLDRETGKPVLPVEERPVKQDAFLHTSPTQPFTAGADRVGPGCVDQNMLPPGFQAGCYFDPVRIDMPNVYMPHMNMRQTPMAYSPQTGYLYASVCVNPAWIRRAESPWVFTRPTRLPGQKQYGMMSAVDSRTGKLVWEKRVAYAGCEGGGGATATAGGLVFHVEPDGNFQAYDAKTGASSGNSRQAKPALAAAKVRRQFGRELRGAGPAIHRADDEPPCVGIQGGRHGAATAGTPAPRRRSVGRTWKTQARCNLVSLPV